MALLKDDKTILFDTVAEFLSEFDSNISKGGLYLDTAAEWPLRTPTDFTIRVTGTDAGVDIIAEVVYCAGGKAGLQIAPDDVAAMRGLVNQLRSGPILLPDGVIEYPSVTAFLADFQANIASGGFYLRSDREWPLAQVQEFTLRIKGHREEAAVRATPVFADGGMVSLQIEYTPDNVNTLNNLVKDLRKALKKKSASAEPVSRPPGRGPGEQPPTSPDTFRGFRGTVVADQNASEFESIRPHDLKPEGRYDLDLFSLIASLCKMERPLRLQIEKNGDRLVVEFDANGDILSVAGHRTEVDLLERLERAGFIDAATRDELRREIDENTNAARLAIDRKVVSEHQVVIALRDQIVDQLDLVRAAGQARFQVDAGSGAGAVGIRFGKLIIAWMEHALKALPAGEIKKMLRPIWEANPVLADDSPWVLGQLDVDDRSYALVKAMDGTKPLKQCVATIEKKARDQVLRLLLGLKALGVISFRGGQGNRVAPERPAGTTGVPSAVEELAAELKDLAEANLFEQAGVHWSAHPGMYKQAMQEMHKRYGPSGDLCRSSPRAAKLCGQRLQLAKAAMTELKNPLRRQEHRREEVPVNLLKQSAKLMLQKARGHLDKQHMKEAIEFLEMAFELDPLPEYKTKLEQVRKGMRKQGS